MSKLFVSSAVFALVAGSAQGTLFFEIEDNDTIATANNIGSFDNNGGAVAIDGGLTVGDVDWFEFEVQVPVGLLISQLGSTNPLADDGQLMLVDSNGTDVLAFADDVIDQLPALNVFFPAVTLLEGTYFLGVSGANDITPGDDPVSTDELFDGLEDNGDMHDEEFFYKLSLAVNLDPSIPTPGAASLAGLAGLATFRRRR